MTFLIKLITHKFFHSIAKLLVKFKFDGMLIHYIMAHKNKYAWNPCFIKFSHISIIK